MLNKYLRNGETTRLRRRLEADAKALHAYYQFGRLHGALRLQWGFLDEWIPAPWRLRGESGLHGMMRRAREAGAELEVVLRSAPGWADPWSRAVRARVVEEGWRSELRDEQGHWIDEREVQAARSV